MSIFSCENLRAGSQRQMRIYLFENFCVHLVGHVSIQKERHGVSEKVRWISPTLMYIIFQYITFFQALLQLLIYIGFIAINYFCIYNRSC